MHNEGTSHWRHVGELYEERVQQATEAQGTNRNDSVNGVFLTQLLSILTSPMRLPLVRRNVQQINKSSEGKSTRLGLYTSGKTGSEKPLRSIHVRHVDCK